MRLKTPLFTITAALLATPAWGQAVLPAKQVVAPAGDIESGMVSLPDPVELGVSSRSLLVEIDPQRIEGDANESELFFRLPADRVGRVVLLPKRRGAWDTTVRTLEGRSLRTGDPAGQAPGMVMLDQPLPWGDPGRMFDCFRVDVHGGGFTIDIDLTERVGGYALISTSPDAALYTYAENLSTLVDQPVTLVSSVTDASPLTELVADVRAPSGARFRVIGDPASGRVVFTPSEPGAHAVRVEAAYVDGDSRPVRLSTQHLIAVESPTKPIGAPRVSAEGGQIEISFDDADSQQRTILAAEVWGRAGAEMVPVCWLARVCDARRSLLLDPRLVLDAGVDPATIELRQARVHRADSLVPTQIVARLAMPLTGQMIDGAMRSDARRWPIYVRDNEPSRAQRGALPGGHRLLLVHGYCSGGNPFTTSHFTGDTAVFHDPEVSRSHDAFAFEILAQTAPMKSFGVVAHSQGAMAALHLYTFYFSGLDWARGERLIQSVGAPYQGTALAGNAAVLGDIFGFGCGENPDMTYAGAANWLSLIPSASRSQVWYATTSYEDRPFAFDYCNIITDILLDDPDDGVIERSAGQLPGATNLGHTEGWCHTQGMRDPAQCTDASRNQQLNARARR